MSELNVEFRYLRRMAVYHNDIKVAEIPGEKYVEWQKEYYMRYCFRVRPGGPSWAEFVLDKLNQKENSFFRSTGYEEGRHG